MKLRSESEVTQSCPTLATLWTAAHQAPPSMAFSRQEYWSGDAIAFSAGFPYLTIIFDVPIACLLCCKLVYSLTPSPTSSKQSLRATEVLSPRLGVLNIHIK